MATYFGFAVADGMFPETCTTSRRPMTVEEVKAALPTAVSCLNPSHVPTIEAARSRFGLSVQVPERAPIVALKSGDSLIVMAVRGLPRLENRHEYTADEIQKAEFRFGCWSVA